MWYQGLTIVIKVTLIVLLCCFCFLFSDMSTEVSSFSLFFTLETKCTQGSSEILWGGQRGAPGAALLPFSWYKHTQPLCPVVILMVVQSRSSLVLLWASRIIAWFIDHYSWWLLPFSRQYICSVNAAADQMARYKALSWLFANRKQILKKLWNQPDCFFSLSLS